MKFYSIISLFIFFIFSCSKEKKQNSIEHLIKEKDIEKLNSIKRELIKERNILVQKIEEINVAINSTDTSNSFFLVSVNKPKDTIFNSSFEVQGNVKNKQNVILGAETSGKLSKIVFKKGAFVKKGNLIAVIHDDGLKDRLNQIKIETKLAKTIFERRKKLWEQKIGSEIQFLEAETNYLSKKNLLKQTKAQLEKTRIRAPFSGTIDDILIEAGNTISLGMPLIRFINLNKMYIEVDLPEKYILSVSKGTPVDIHFPVINKTVSSNISTIGNYVNPNNRSFKIEIPLPKKMNFIKPNLTVLVKINNYTNPKALLIPEYIISKNSKNKKYIYVISDIKENSGTVNKRFIETGVSQGGMIEVTHSLTADDYIVIEGSKAIKDGQKVKLAYE